MNSHSRKPEKKISKGSMIKIRTHTRKLTEISYPLDSWTQEPVNKRLPFIDYVLTIAEKHRFNFDAIEVRVPTEYGSITLFSIDRFLNHVSCLRMTISVGERKKGTRDDMVTIKVSEYALDDEGIRSSKNQLLISIGLLSIAKYVFRDRLRATRLPKEGFWSTKLMIKRSLPDSEETIAKQTFIVERLIKERRLLNSIAELFGFKTIIFKTHDYYREYWDRNVYNERIHLAVEALKSNTSLSFEPKYQNQLDYA
jgi:hypothetical protein